MNTDYMTAKISQVKEQLAQSRADADRFRKLNVELRGEIERLKSELENCDDARMHFMDASRALQDEVDQLRAELDRTKKVADERKLRFNIALSLLDNCGYNVHDLLECVAMICVEIERESENGRG